MALRALASWCFLREAQVWAVWAVSRPERLAPTGLSPWEGSPCPSPLHLLTSPCKRSGSPCATERGKGETLPDVWGIILCHQAEGFCFFLWWWWEEPLLDTGRETSVCCQPAWGRDQGSLSSGLSLCAPQTPKRQKRLFCRYHDGNRTPQLLIAPFKEEDEWDSPHIVRYYDVMSDEEIQRIKDIAKPKVGVSAGPSRVTHSWHRGRFVASPAGLGRCPA